MAQLTGGCLCGEVRYASSELRIPATLCHCPSCRRASGSHVLGLLTVARSGFRITAGSPHQYRSSAAVLRTFCPRCGTPLTYWHESWPDDISLTIGSLDMPEVAPPADHTWMSAAISWDDPADGLPRFQTDRLSPVKT